MNSDHQNHNPSHRHGLAHLGSVIVHPLHSLVQAAHGAVEAEHRIVAAEHRAVSTINGKVDELVVKALCLGATEHQGPHTPLIRLARAAKLPEAAALTSTAVRAFQQQAGCASGALITAAITHPKDFAPELVMTSGMIALTVLGTHHLHPHNSP
jgi:hypothetical protein